MSKQSSVLVSKSKGTKEVRVQATLESLDDIRQETAQISELTTEEDMLVAEYTMALVDILRPLAPAITVSTSILPEEWGKVNEASLDHTGQLLILGPGKKMRAIDLTARKHRELLLKVTRDIMPTLKNLVTEYRQGIEARVSFMSSVTEELQRTAKAFSPDDFKQPIS
ncbi:MAG: hypothetical protein JSW53_02890 [Candidatus Bathyarchaeota archaeon]|nr:MAG: hypothetical protein JSW53_02890 [Candidatus Bathyarchaeota archaeon]